jgi:hypothetical protein
MESGNTPGIGLFLRGEGFDGALTALVDVINDPRLL